MKHAQKRLIPAVVAVTIGFTAVGCGSSSSGSGSAQPTSALSGRGPITLALGTTDLKQRQAVVDAWNTGHPTEKVTMIDLGAAADQQRQLLIQNAQTKSDAYSVILLDVVWTAEFAANQWVKPLDPSLYPMGEMLKPAIATATYRDKLYAVPVNSEGGMFYYRTDLLKAAGIAAPPSTWEEMEKDCTLIQATPQGKGVGCYVGQFDKYEGLTVNFAEAVDSAGGEIVGSDGKPNVDTPEALAGLTTLVDAFKSHVIPPKAVTYEEEDGRKAFQDGSLIFERQWAYMNALANATDGSSKVAGKFATTTIPGIGQHPGASTLGGHNLALSSFAKNTQTASDFIAFMAAKSAQQSILEASAAAPGIASLYDDQSLISKFPFLPTLKKSNETAVPRPIAVNYGDVTAAIQNEAYAAISGSKAPAQALKDLQANLESIVS
jgi:multiple sugar transport system substrate-binding protein